jgi:hypothetical protein
MAVTAEYLHRAGEVIAAAGSLRDAAALWRARDPAMRVLLLDALDMRDETPALRLGARRVYLAASSGHCWSITDQPEAATALILTQEPGLHAP